MTALGQLLRTQRELAKMTLQEVANASTAAGYKISQSQVGNLESAPLTEMPKVRTMRGLSRALRIPVSVIVDAALEDLGLRRSASPSNDLVSIWSRTENLSERERQLLMRQVKALIDASSDQP